MTDCLILQPIDRIGLARLVAAGLDVHVAATPELENLRPHLATARAVITRNFGFPAEWMVAAPRLQIIVAHGTGTDRINRAAAMQHSIAIANTPGTNAQAVAEHTLALMLACVRAIPAADHAIRAGHFGFRDQHMGRELAGQTLGLVGYGRIGRKVGQLAQAFGMRVVAVSRYAEPEAIQADGVVPMADLESLCEEAEIVSLHTLPDSTPLIDSTHLIRMRRGAVLINTARGALIDEAALATALHTGHLSAAALDVFQVEPLPRDSPLLACPNLVLTPHLGGVAREAMERTALAAADAVLRGLRCGAVPAVRSSTGVEPGRER